MLWRYVATLYFRARKTQAISIQFSKSGEFIYFIAEDIARGKIFTLQVPPTPDASTTHPVLASPFDTPIALTDTHVASGLQVLSEGRLLFALSSLTSPNDAYILGNLQQVEADIRKNASSHVKGQHIRITSFSDSPLEGKHLDPGEDFWFQGAEHEIHGWILTPPGCKPTDVKKWPVVLLIHGGEFCHVIK